MARSVTPDAKRLDFTPQYVVHDVHPGYVSSQWASEMNMPTRTVLHHHAHAAACLAEHQWPLDGGDVIALTLDGIGMGENGALWGGECLRVNYRANVSTWAACLQWRFRVAIWRRRSRGETCWRSACALCRSGRIILKQQVCQQQNWSVLARAIERGINARWRHRVGGCSMPWRRHWAVRHVKL